MSRDLIIYSSVTFCQGIPLEFPLGIISVIEQLQSHGNRKVTYSATPRHHVFVQPVNECVKDILVINCFR